MNIITTIKKVAKTVIHTVKNLIDMVKASYEVKKMKMKTWHEFKQQTNPDYMDALITIVVSIAKILIPIQSIRTSSSDIVDIW